MVIFEVRSWSIRYPGGLVYQGMTAYEDCLDIPHSLRDLYSSLFITAVYMCSFHS